MHEEESIMKKLVKKSVIAILITGILGSVLIGCGNASDEKVEINDTSIPSAENIELDKETEKINIRVANFAYASWNAAFDVAYQLGYFEDAFEEDVTVEVLNFQNGPAVNEAFLAGEVDIVNGIGDQPIITSLSNGQNNYVIGAATQEPAFGLVIKEDSDIKSVADLKGKKVQFSVGTSAHKIVLSYLSQAELTGEDIEIVNLQDDDAAKAGLAAGDIDAIFLSGVNYIKAEENGIGKKLPGADSVPLYAYIEASKSFVETYPNVTKEFLAAVQKGKEFLDNNKEEGYQAIAELTGYDYEYVETLVNEADYSIELTDALIENLNTTSEFLSDQELINQPVSREDIEKHIWKAE